MGCCVGLKNDIFNDKEIIINLGPKEIENFLGTKEDFFKDNSKSNNRKTSSQSVETNAESPKKVKKRKKSQNYHNQRIKDITKNLKLFTISEIKNMSKFFVLK